MANISRIDAMMIRLVALFKRNPWLAVALSLVEVGVDVYEAFRQIEEEQRSYIERRDEALERLGVVP
jgi:hypothetical protein